MAERALYFWNNEYFCNLVGDNVEIILPIMFPSLYENSQGHWNRLVHLTRGYLDSCLYDKRTIHSMVYTAMKMFMEINPQLFDDCSHEYRELQNSAPAREQNRKAKWERLEEMARVQQGKGKAACRPAKPLAKLPTHPEDPELLTQDNRQRLNALKLQDETATGIEANQPRLPEQGGQTSVSGSRPG